MSLGTTEIIKGLEIYETQKIASTSYSVVYHGKFGDVEVAVKKIPDFVYFVDKKYIQPEHESLGQLLRHPNVVRYFHYVQKEGWVYLALEKCDTDLHSEIEKWRNQNNSPNQAVAVNIAAQICNGLHYLHQKGFVHRDMKPANVLLTWMADNSLSVKICDMGISRKLDPGRFTFSETADLGSAGFKPFELLEAINKGVTAKHVSFSVDVFPLGVTFHMLLSSGKHPFGDRMNRDINILHKKEPDIERNSLCYEAQDLISDMINHEADDRLVYPL